MIDDYQYTYDGAGNRLTQTVNGTTTSYTYNNANELTSDGSTTYNYDANGNLTGNGAGLSLSYNTLIDHSFCGLPTRSVSTAFTCHLSDDGKP